LPFQANKNKRKAVESYITKGVMVIKGFERVKWASMQNGWNIRGTAVPFCVAEGSSKHLSSGTYKKSLKKITFFQNSERKSFFNRFIYIAP